MSLTIGDWKWDGEHQRLNVEIEANSGYKQLEGNWALQDFSVLLDGLSFRELKHRLGRASGSVTSELLLAEGTKIQLAGAFTSPQTASGLILECLASLKMDYDPGPALVPVFQPIINLQSGEIAGFEALARWPDGENEAEHYFDDRALVSNMLIQACHTLSELRASSGNEKLFIQVNITGRDLAESDLTDLVSALISSHGLMAGGLKLELTEQAALRDRGAAIEELRRLREAGASIVLDDFGSGHSSFIWLSELPADGLKIDADLISKLHDKRGRMILKSVADLANSLGLSSTAEGVEKLEDVPTLRQLGFIYAQGFALGRPMLADKARALFERQVLHNE